MPNAHCDAILHYVSIKSAQSCIKCASSLQFLERAVFFRKTARSNVDFVQNTCTLADCVAELGHIFVRTFEPLDGLEPLDDT